jgi:2-oxoglutarate dehydrogenase E1 component
MASVAPNPPQESWLSGNNAAYLEALYADWEQDPSTVHPSFRTYFENEAAGVAHSYVSPPGLNAVKSTVPVGGGDIDPKVMLDTLNVVRLIRSYQISGHALAHLDPLAIGHGSLIEPSKSLELSEYGFTDADLDRKFMIAPAQRNLFGNEAGPFSLRDIHERLKQTYCQRIGFEYMHIQDSDRCDWLRQKIETPFQGFTDDERKSLALDLIKSHGFENFLMKKYVTEKRFGVDGCESLIPAMNRMVGTAVDQGVELIVMGMPHRGRLNVLHNVLKKPMGMIFNEFTSTLGPKDWGGSGDVKYHLGMSSQINLNGKEVNLSLLANPSHLEAVDPVVIGKVRAEQLYRGDVTQQRVMPVLLHGDAAFAGQGVVYETLGLSELPAYGTGGTLHIVVNNQIGFTTDPRASRSTPYCTDVAKAVDAPIFHVNGDDVEAVARVMDIAVEWRQTFGTDVVVDIVCYRRFGHNETDQPKFTQPLMYQRIEKQRKTIDIYSEILVGDGVVTPDWIKENEVAFDAGLEETFGSASEYDPETDEEMKLFWEGMALEQYQEKSLNTGIESDVISHIGDAISSYPDDFIVHPALKRVLKGRSKMFEGEGDLDWATGEALAFGSLLLEGTHVRLSGQDVERGTFSHRHHVIHDQESDGKTFRPLDHLSDDQAPYTVCNSHLSEYGVLGFELGYSQANPHSLVIWEAQFGDFANTAQCIIDQFICSGEDKWGRQSGIVMQLPHGYEGMGPEHSSARLERFLQLSDDDEDVYPETDGEFAYDQIQDGNWQIVNATTPANIFHALRRQVHRPFRKPLIVMSPKSLLRHPQARSTLGEIAPGSWFKRLIPETDAAIYDGAANAGVRKVVFCSGKVYYDLLNARTEKEVDDVALVRVEQLSPFPMDLVHKHADEFPNAELVWAQEEPRNMGGWSYVSPRIETSMTKSTHHQDKRVTYVGRAAAASTATGDKVIHKRQFKDMMDAAFA